MMKYVRTHNLDKEKIIIRERKSPFVRLFDKTPQTVLCPHFYELILSNGCPFNCSYCYLQLTFRGQTQPTLFCNPWSMVQKELDKFSSGIFSTGELADSLAIIPPLLGSALEYFPKQSKKYLLLLTKSTNIEFLLDRHPNPQVIVSFSVNASPISEKFEKGAPNPDLRMEAALELKKMGWRVRIRLDPIILENGLGVYEDICRKIADLDPELVTIGTLRQYPGLYRFAHNAPRKDLCRAKDGRMRYSFSARSKTYKQIQEWLGFQPALCKETKDMWKDLGWHFQGCNCTNGLFATSID
jgi:spore photoproduct lyase